MSDANSAAMAAEVFVQAGADFGLSLLRESISNGSATAVLSPISIAFALSLAYAGAGGDTRKQFNAVFAKNGQSSSDIDAFFARSFKQFNSANKSVTLDVANRAYVDASLEVKQAYKDAVSQKLGGDFVSVNFGNKQAAANKINSFIADATQNKIKDLIDESGLDPATKLLLVNAVYFKGKWAEPFNADATKDGNFSVAANNDKTVKMMHKSFKTPYADNEQVQVLVLPYTDSNSQLVVYLPKEKFGLTKWLQSVSGKQLLDLRAEAKITSGDINISLPRFKIEKKLELATTLSKIGFSDAFGGNANFTGIADASPPLKIGDVVHKAFIEVNEAGTEAAAATGVVMRTIAYFKPIDFVANHPFAYAVFYENQPIFLGVFAGDD